MRITLETPKTELEQIIEDVLYESGHNREEIQFRDDDRYLRIGYWEKLDAKSMSQLEDVITEESVYDDDRGWLFLYRVKKP
jgi:hypothetical protein